MSETARAGGAPDRVLVELDPHDVDRAREIVASSFTTATYPGYQLAQAVVAAADDAAGPVNACQDYSCDRVHPGITHDEYNDLHDRAAVPTADLIDQPIGSKYDSAGRHVNGWYGRVDV